MPQNTGASASADRATRASPKPGSGLGHKASVPCAFTPGPWRVRQSSIAHSRVFDITTDGHHFDRELLAFTSATCAQSEANARLIAAAPELYEAADHMLVAHESESETHYAAAIEKLRTALAKARGDLA